MSSPTSENRTQNSGLLAWAYRPFWEKCEKRLALSAMPWMPWSIGPQELHSAIHSHDTCQAVPANDIASNQHTDPSIAPPLEQHLSEAHSQTGWNQVHNQYGLGGHGQTVAVIDSGIAFDHVALGKGYGPGYRVVGGWDFAENDARPYDDAPAGFHGTHVSGIIGANDGVQMGVAPNVDLVALRVFNDSGKGDLAWTESALKWVHDHRNDFANPITTVNLSLGAAWNSSTVPNWGTLEDELSQLQRDGIVVVVSAGNSFQQYKTPGLSYPAASPFVIPVSSVDANGQLSDFSQRDPRSIAAPGRSIESTVPDYFYGKDGINNDWATASGTSMAAPYVAGASVLVREAMELVGIQNITPQSIYEQLRSTANSIWDSVTQQNYLSLDLDRAIESLLPKDTVGDSIANGMMTSVQSTWQTEGWINSLGDRDVYRLMPSQSGTVTMQFASDHISDSIFGLLRGNQETAITSDHGRLSFSVTAGEAIGLSIADFEAIGPYHLNWSFAASSSGGGENPGPIPSNVVRLGEVDIFEQQLVGTARYQLTAEHTGILSIVVDADQQTTGTLRAMRTSDINHPVVDSKIENHQWRVDLNVVQGESVEFVLPSSANHSVHLVNLMQQQGSQATLFATERADRVAIDLSHGLSVTVAGVDYQLDTNVIKTIRMDGGLNNDSLNIVGSPNAEKIEMRPGQTTLVNAQISIQADNIENVQFIGGGGPDRAYLYDAATDDRLNIWPNKADMTGVGYTFSVDQIDRIFVHALQGGDDQAFVFDSAGNDALSVRPQFTSLSGDNFFNYISGFERVFAYATAGGIDNASLYDSSGDDLFNTSGEVTSIVGPGFSTFARGFDNVEAFASAGGRDRANIYAPAGGHLTAGADFVGMQDSTRTSIARNFEQISTFVSGQSVPVPNYSAASIDTPLLTAQSIDESAPSNVLGSATSENAQAACPMPQHQTGADSVPAHTAFPNDGAPHEASEGTALDWLTQWVDRELRSQRAELGSSILPTEEKIRQLSDLDLSWMDQANEREVLNSIFADL